MLIIESFVYIFKRSMHCYLDKVICGDNFIMSIQVHDIITILSSVQAHNRFYVTFFQLRQYAQLLVCYL